MRHGYLYEMQKPQFSGHETFPLRYGWLKKVYDAVYSLEEAGQADKARELFTKDDSAIARFGVGKNMVGSMRHWATACGVIEETNEGIFTTKLAKILFPNDGLDPWSESASSLWLFHWNIASNSSKATYVWLFSYYNNLDFDRNVLVKMMLDVCEQCEGWRNMAEATIRRDVECLVRAYVNKPSKQENFTEDQIESPLAELGLMQPTNKNDTFQLRRGRHASLSDGVFLYALVDFWKRDAGEARTLSLEKITYDPCSPGRVLCLDEDAIAERLYNIEQTSGGQLLWTETAGLRQIMATKPLDNIIPLDFLIADYRGTNTRKKVA